MLRKSTDEDISDEECEKIINPFYDNYHVNLSLLKHKIFANHCKMVIFLSNLTFCYCVRFVRLI